MGELLIVKFFGQLTDINNMYNGMTWKVKLTIMKDKKVEIGIDNKEL